MKLNPNATSHEGPHLFRHSRLDIFMVIWSAGNPGGWYWQDASASHGPFSASVYAYMDAKEHRPSTHNPRHLPVAMDHELRALAEGLLLLYCHFHFPRLPYDMRCYWESGERCDCGPNSTCFEE